MMIEVGLEQALRIVVVYFAEQADQLRHVEFAQKMTLVRALLDLAVHVAGRMMQRHPEEAALGGRAPGVVVRLGRWMRRP